MFNTTVSGVAKVEVLEQKFKALKPMEDEKGFIVVQKVLKRV